MSLDEIVKLLCEVARGNAGVWETFYRLEGRSRQIRAHQRDSLALIFRTYEQGGCLNRLPEMAPAVYVLMNRSPVPKEELERFDPKTIHLGEDEPR
ncbi:hypothetical protein CL654_00830 [bacterium]|nr:hypothetical protein [bacterium]